MQAFRFVLLATISLLSTASGGGCDSKPRNGGDGQSAQRPVATAGTFRLEAVVVPVHLGPQAGAGFIAKINGSHFFVTNRAEPDRHPPKLDLASLPSTRHFTRRPAD